MDYSNVNGSSKGPIWLARHKLNDTDFSEVRCLNYLITNQYNFGSVFFFLMKEMFTIMLLIRIYLQLPENELVWQHLGPQ